MTWVARIPTVDVAPATDEPRVSDPQLSFERETINEPEQQTAEVAGTLSEAEARRITESTLQQYEEEGGPYFSSARLWDDGILDPMDTRKVLGLCLDIAAGSPTKETRAPVFRM